MFVTLKHNRKGKKTELQDLEEDIQEYGKQT